MLRDWAFPSGVPATIPWPSCRQPSWGVFYATISNSGFEKMVNWFPEVIRFLRWWFLYLKVEIKHRNSNQNWISSFSSSLHGWVDMASVLTWTTWSTIRTMDLLVDPWATLEFQDLCRMSPVWPIIQTAQNHYTCMTYYWSGTCFGVSDIWEFIKQPCQFFHDNWTPQMALQIDKHSGGWFWWQYDYTWFYWN